MTPVRVTYWPRQEHENHTFARTNTIADILEKLGNPKCYVRLGGSHVDPEWYHRVTPKPGVVLDITVIPGNFGIGGGLIPSTTLRLALGVLSSGLGLLTQIAVPGIGGQVLGGAVNIGGLLLTNALVPPAQLPLDEIGYSIQGSRNRLRPYEPIPRVYGRVRVYPDLAAPPYTEIGNDNSQYIRLLFCVGHGRLRLSDFRIGNTPINRFNDIEWEALQGQPGDKFTQTVFVDQSSVDEQSLNILLDQTPNEVRVDTAQSGTSSTITLDSDASGQDDFYVGMTITITSGTGSPSSERTITAYNGSTKVATITPNWVVTPDATSQFEIVDPNAWTYQVTEADTSEISLDISFPQGLQARSSDGTTLAPLVEFAIEYRLKGTTDTEEDDSFQTRWTRLSYPDLYRPHNPSTELGGNPLQELEDRLQDVANNLDNWADIIEFTLGSGDRAAPVVLLSALGDILGSTLDRIGLIQEQITLDAGVYSDLVNVATRLNDLFDDWGVTTFRDMTDEAREVVDAVIRRIPILGDLLEANRYITSGDPDDLEAYLQNAPSWIRLFYGYQGLDDLLGGYPAELVVHEGTAQAGSAATITLDTGASSNDNEYKDMTIEIVSGTGAGQSKTISSYIGSTRVATTSENFSPIPDSTSQFRILEGNNIRVSDNSSAIVRRTLRWTPASGPGLYEVRIRRVTPTDRTSGTYEIRDEARLTAFRSVFRDKAPVLREGLALVAMRIKASDQLSGILEQFNCIAESYLPIWDGAQWTEGLTRNPAWAYCDILRNEIARPVVADSQIDLEDILEWAEAMNEEEFLNNEAIREDTAQGGGASTITLDVGASAVDDFYNGEKVAIVAGAGVGQVRTISDYVGATKVATVSEAWDVQPDNTSDFRILEIEKVGRTFDAKLDRDLTKLEALRTIAAAGRASYAVSPAGRYSVVRDVAQTAIRQHFSLKNTKDFTWNRAYPELPHAIKIEFPDSDNDFVINEETVYRDDYTVDTATIFERLQLPGVTDRWQAYKDGRYWLDVAELRPEVYQFTTDWEFLDVKRGDLIRKTNDLALFGIGSGRIKAIVTESSGDVTHIVTDEPFPMDSGETYEVSIRAYNNETIRKEVVTNPGDSATIEFTTPISSSGTLPQVGDLVLYGPQFVDLLVKEIRPQRDMRARIVCVDAAPDVHVGDAIPIPPRDPQTTIPPALNPPSPPAPIIASDLVRSGTCQSGSVADTIKLDAGASGVSNVYNAMVVKIVAGTGVGQVRVIQNWDGAYDGTSKVAYIQPNWTNVPNSSSEFEIYESKIVSGEAAAVISGDGSVTNKMVIPIEVPDIPTGVELRSIQGRIRTYVNVRGAIDEALLGSGNAVDIQRALNDYTAWANAALSPYFDWEKNQIIFDNVGAGVIYEVQARYITKTGVVSEWSEIRSHTVNATDIGPLKAAVDAIQEVVQDGELLLADNKRLLFGDGLKLQLYWDGTYFRIKDSAGNIRWTITSDGKIGYGSTAPTYLLHMPIAGDFFQGHRNSRIIQKSDVSDETWNEIRMQSATFGSLWASNLGWTGAANPPTTMVHKVPSGRYGGMILFQGATGIWRFYVSNASTGVDGAATMSERARFSQSDLFFSVSGGNDIYINSSGNVGMGNNSPSYKLDVTGVFRCTSHAYVGGSLGVGNTAPAYKADITGDIRTTLGGHSNDFWRVTKNGFSTNLMDGLGLFNELLGEQTSVYSTTSVTDVVAWSQAVFIAEHRAIFQAEWEALFDDGDVTPDACVVTPILASSAAGTTPLDGMFFVGGKFYGPSKSVPAIKTFRDLTTGPEEWDNDEYSIGRAIIAAVNFTPGTYYINFLIRSEDVSYNARIKNMRVRGNA